MNLRRPISLWLVLASLAMAPAAGAETVRVASWSFPAAPGEEPRVAEAAQALQRLEPDVILLQRVRDWETCAALAQALKPADYAVLVCSAFHGPTNAAASPQVAILSKAKGYVSWSEPWQGAGGPAVPGGFAFAAVQFPRHRVGFFAVDPQAVGTLRAAATHAALSQQWGRAVATVKAWVTNRLEAVVVAGGDPGAEATPAALTTGFLSAPLHRPITLSVSAAPTKTADSLVPAGLRADARTLPALVLLGAQAACALNLDVPPAAVAQAAPPKVPAAPAVAAQAQPAPVASSLTASAPSPGPVMATAPPQPAAAQLRPYLILGGAVAVVLPVVWFWARRRRPSPAAGVAVLPGREVSSYTLVVSQPPLAGGESPAAVPAPVPQRVALLAEPRSAAGPGEAWPPGPVLLSPELPGGAARDRAGLRWHLAQWLKQKLLQKLLSDRSEMLQTQQTASVKLLSFEERLAKLEQQLQQQNRAYEQRILELNHDLTAAKEENRELIRARIAQVKAEMELARARLLAQARAGER